MGFEPMTSAIPVWCSTNWAVHHMKPHWKQVKCKFNLYLWYEENDMMHIQYDKGHGFESHWSLRVFLGFICDCLSYFMTARLTFTCILYPQCTYMIFIIYTYNFPFQCLTSHVQYSMEKLACDLMLGSTFAELSILSTVLIYFLVAGWETLGQQRVERTNYNTSTTTTTLAWTFSGKMAGFTTFVAGPVTWSKSKITEE